MNLSKIAELVLKNSGQSSVKGKNGGQRSVVKERLFLTNGDWRLCNDSGRGSSELQAL
jgi:hypothetical protein